VLSRPATVIVADDERNLRDSLSELLSGEGYRVLQASDGNEALALLGDEPSSTDALLLDLKMPGCGGLEALEVIGGDPRTREIPVIVITAFGGSEQTIAAMKAGAYDYITNPSTPKKCSARPPAPSRGAGARPASPSASGTWPGNRSRFGADRARPRHARDLQAHRRVAPTDDGAHHRRVRHRKESSRAPSRAQSAGAPPARRRQLRRDSRDSPRERALRYGRGVHRGRPVEARTTRSGQRESLFLDEIGELAPSLQAKLLRVLRNARSNGSEGTGRCARTSGSSRRRTGT
jgi:CheY-like chemotaxis protein